MSASTTVDVRALLNLPPLENDDETESDAITALILSASQDETPTASLEDIYSVLCQSRSESHLDPLTILPPLLQTRRAGATNLVSLIGECGSAKEIVIAVQEILERVARAVADEEVDESGQAATPAEQLLALIGLSTAAIPRLKLRKKSPSETLAPLLAQLARTLHLAGPNLSREHGRQALSGVCELVKNAFTWAQGYDAAEDATQNILKTVVDSALSDCCHCLHSALAQRTFERLFPRLTIRSQVPADWEDGEAAVANVLATYTSLGLTLVQPASPAVSYLVLLAHSSPLPNDVNRLLSFLLPLMISSIQTMHALDETIALILQSLHAPMFSAGHQLSPDVSGPLCAVLPSLASSHPDPQTRHQAFRIISRILALTPSELRIQILKDLVSDAQYPQMRVAAVGLTKESVLEALSREKSADLFASPYFLQVFGPILLRPDPPDLFDAKLTLEEISQSSEPARLVECLSLYYILLLRDKTNRTGVRDGDQIRNVERGLLAPIRAALLRWMAEADAELSSDHLHAELMPLVSLKMSVERVDAAVADLQQASKP
ncbi:hypothetical protein HMN09_00941700 [Mycena chlorophos]|uniref:Uncharacterized protein n=1 Tax=Mycena chlorophos TaxID=658473 RepID=A0A8H6SJ31_MYCCL|nr:hypothetical protein HMN09_00941700 [Mycena chlorophos]